MKINKRLLKLNIFHLPSGFGLIFINPDNGLTDVHLLLAKIWYIYIYLKIPSIFTNHFQTKPQKGIRINESQSN